MSNLTVPALRPLVLAVAVLTTSMSLPAWAGATCELLDSTGVNIGDGGAGAGNDTGEQADSTACGRNAVATAPAATALGDASQALGSRSIALGSNSVAIAADVVSLGHGAGDLDVLGNPFGSDLNRRLTHLADGINATDAVNVRQLNAAMSNAGSPYMAINAAASDIGSADAQAPRLGSIAIGSNAMANTAGNNYGIAVGAASQAQGYSSVAIGPVATTSTSAFGSVALGLYAVANEAGVVSFGYGVGDSVVLPGSGNTITFNSEQTRRLIHVGAATADTDAVNLSQLHPLASALGGGASYASGAFAPPAYTIQGANYADVGSAFAAVDVRLSQLQSSIDGIETTPGPAGPAGPQGPAGPGSELAVEYDGNDSGSITLAGTGGTVISNLADGAAARDAVNKGQMDAGDARTLTAAGDYTNARETAVRSDMAAGDTATLQAAQIHARSAADGALQAANAYTDSQMAVLNDRFDLLAKGVDDRLRGYDRRLDRVGAMGGAMAAAALNTAGLSGRNRMGIGVGMQGGESALAMGYQRVIGDRMSLSLSAGFSGDDRNVSAGAGFSW